MRVLLVFSALVVCALSIEIDFKPILEVQEDLNLGQQFQDFVVKFGKKYANDTLELASRYSIYKSNRMLVNELNLNDDDFATYSLDTPFADMTPEEFKRRILMKGSSIPKFPLSRYMKAPKLKDIPSSFDWRENNAVSPVKDQGSYAKPYLHSLIFC